MRYVYFLFLCFALLFFCLIPPSFAAEDTNISSRYAAKNMAVPLTLLPRDKYGIIDWAGSVRSGIISPLSSIDGLTEDDDPIDLLVPIKAKNEFMTDVMFPHSIHTYWLSCKICHPKIFVQKKGGNPEMTMWKILAGEYCGRCHGKIAFPLRECYRCHMERETKMEKVKNE
jgi:c(7)-type cytochrome triheme protein